jgi:seryl-tRNA synthetase
MGEGAYGRSSRNALNRNYNFPLDKFVELDALRRETLLEVEALKEKRNAGAKEVG